MKETILHLDEEFLHLHLSSASPGYFVFILSTIARAKVTTIADSKSYNKCKLLFFKNKNLTQPPQTCFRTSADSVLLCQTPANTGFSMVSFVL
jgi:hypothetical protein